MRKNFLSFILVIIASFLTAKIGYCTTQTYYITSNANLPDMPSVCGGYYGFSNNYRITWTDVIPAGSTINSVQVTYCVGVECNSGQWYSTQLNGWAGNFYSQTPQNCSCAGYTSYGPQSMPTGGYIIGGLNTFTIWGSSAWNFGLWPGLASSAFAIVTVDYSGTPTINTSGTLSDFGSQCINTSSSYQSYSVTGSSLSANLIVTPPSGFEVSTDASSWYSSLSIAPSSGNVNATIYVHFIPSSATVYSGNITNASTGATTINVAASGTGVSIPPSISSPFAQTVSSTSAQFGGVITSVGCGSVTERGIFWSTTTPLADGAGTKVYETGSFGTGGFTEAAVTGLTPGTHYYYKAYAQNNSGIVYTSEGDYIYYASGNPFQYLYTPYANQYATTGFYTDGSKMIIAGYGPNSYPTYYNGIISKADTASNFMQTWYLTHSYGFQITKIRKKDADNSIFSGVVYNTPWPNQAQASLIGVFNHTTGTMGTAYWYNDNLPAPASPTRWGNANTNDLTLLSNGDIAIVGAVNENWSSASGPSNMGMCCGNTWNGYGYFAGDFGATGSGIGYYQRAGDVFLIRTGSDGDTAHGAGNDGFIKKYSLAYSGGSYNPAQPTAIGHPDGGFYYTGMPTWIADSTRDDAASSVIEVGAAHNLFIAGVTQNYGSASDYEAFVIKTSSSGGVLWCRTYYINSTVAAHEEADAIAAVTSDGSNDVIIAMRSVQSGNVELARLANATGNIVWAKSYNFGVQTRPWSIKQTSYNTFIVGVYDYSGSIGSGDMILLEIDRDGNVVQSKGYGTSNCDGSDCWFDEIGPLVDQFGTGTNYAIAATTNFSGGYGASSYVVKANKVLNSSGCISNEFNISPTVINRNSGGANQLISRKPIIYELKAGPDIKYASMSISTGSLTTSAGAICYSTLPIKLMEFTSICKNGNVTLNWSTASEQNNNYFTVERSADGINFQPIGKVNGSGNSSILLNYSFVDESPFSSGRGVGGEVYYRLSQTDFNGQSEAFSPISVSCSGNSGFAVAVNPNPIDNGKINLAVSTSNKENVLVVVTDVFGQQLYSKVLVEDVDSFLFTIDLQDKLAPGIYFVTASSNDKFLSKKIIVR